MNTVTTEPMLLGYATPIRSDDRLFEAAQLGTESLEKLIDQHGLDPAKRELLWGSSDEKAPVHVSVVLSERDDYGSRNVSRLTTRARLLDPITREEMMINLLMDARSKRWYQMRERLDRGIEELEQEELANGHPH